MMRSDPAVVGAPQLWPPPPLSPPPPSPPPLPSSSSVIANATDEKGFLNCTPGICTSDCPQSCGFYILSPPPPFDTGDDDSSGRISPLMAALIAVLAAAFLLLFYYTVVSRFCRRQRHRRRNLRAQILHESDDHPEIRLDPMVQDPTRPNGLDEAFIRQITVFKYRRADGLIDGTDCAVCLSEFKEEENLRLMPNCEHAFHIPCIDTWLKTHSSCPLCRATMNPIPPRPTPSPNPNPNPNPNPSANGTTASVAEMRVQSGNDIVLLVREVVGSGDEEVVVCHETEDDGCGDSEERESEEEVRKGDNNQR